MQDRYRPFSDEWRGEGFDGLDGRGAQARSAGLRRLSKLTWRATQLGAIATVGFATVFARTAPTQTVASQPSAKPAVRTPAPSPSPAPTKVHRRHHRHHHVATPVAPSTPIPSAAPSLAPPTAPPAPAPSPTPVHTTSSPSHGGGG
ncbi:MAG TPA: hypothetical protein VGS19_10480 [Streptosporangiaceae bacterium]|nr:hypothetical protein [Streptosporangiaceae bacterium]